MSFLFSIVNCFSSFFFVLVCQWGSLNGTAWGCEVLGCQRFVRKQNDRKFLKLHFWINLEWFQNAIAVCLFKILIISNNVCFVFHFDPRNYFRTEAYRTQFVTNSNGWGSFLSWKIFNLSPSKRQHKFSQLYHRK